MTLSRSSALSALTSSSSRGQLITLLLLAVTAAAAQYARAVVSPLQETIKDALRLSDYQMALLQGPALALPMTVAAIVIGLTIDKLSRTRVLVLLALGTILGSFATAAATSFAAFFAARCVVGLATATNPIVISLIADLYPPSKRGRATMVVAFGQVGGYSIVFAAGGLLAATDPGNWRAAIAWVAAPLLLTLFATLAMREPPRGEVAKADFNIRRVIPELWSRSPVLAPLIGGIFILETAYGAMLVWTAPLLSRSFELSPDRVGLILSVSLFVTGLLGPMTGGVLADWCQRGGGPKRTALAMAGLAALSIAASSFAIAPTLSSCVALFIGFKVLISALVVIGTVLLTVVVPNELRGACIGILVAGGILTNGFAPLLASFLSDAMGGSHMIGHVLALICAAASAFGASLFLITSRHLPKHDEDRPAHQSTTQQPGMHQV